MRVGFGVGSMGLITLAMPDLGARIPFAGLFGRVGSDLSAQELSGITVPHNAELKLERMNQNQRK